MEYDIIEKVSDIAASDLKLDAKLSEAARVLLRYFPFEQCLLYFEDSGALKLRQRPFVACLRSGSSRRGFQRA